MKRVIQKNFVLLLILIAEHSKSQQRDFPKNFPELFAGVEWNTASGLTGINYERYLFEKDKWVIGARVSHAFDYSLANLALFNTGDGGTGSFNSMTGTIHKFFTPTQRGFFFCSELGWGLRTYRYYGVEYSAWFAAFELGFGCQLSLGRKAAIRWSNTITFAGKGGITATKLSVGF